MFAQAHPSVLILGLVCSQWPWQHHVSPLPQGYPHFRRISRDSPSYPDTELPISLYKHTQREHAHMHSWEVLLVTYPHMSLEEVSRRTHTCATTTESHGSHWALFPWRPRRIIRRRKTDHRWKNNLVLFLRPRFVCALCAFVEIIGSVSSDCWFVPD